MNTVKDLVLECDFFAHGTLQRYRHGDSFPTLTGGVVSIIWVTLFVGMFSSMMIDTFQTNIIFAQLGITYDDDPTASLLKASPEPNFMFAIGLTGINLGASQRYFDISLINRSTQKFSNGSKVKIKDYIALEPCTLAHWQGVSESITNSFTTLSFSEWLCPPVNYSLTMQGKYTSNMFQFAQINIDPCNASNPNFPNTTCYNSTDINNFLNIMAQFTFNFYYINPVINANDKKYISYYLEDRNYFSFDTITGVSANLFFTQYNIETDITILPWK